MILMQLSLMATRWHFSHPLLAASNHFVMHIEIRHQPFNPWQELDAYTRLASHRHQAGACATFVGSMRDFNEGDTVRTMHLEHYPGMTEKQLGVIVRPMASYGLPNWIRVTIGTEKENKRFHEAICEALKKIEY